MVDILVFFCEPIGQWEYSFDRHGNVACPARPDRHCHGRNTLARFASRDDFPVRWPDLSDPAWPVKCDHCGGHLHQGNSDRSSGSRQVFRRTDTGEELGSGFPVGSVYEVECYGDDDWCRRGPDGRALVVETPGGPWHVDNRASNCTMPTDNEHRCWVRHGRPEDGTLHVDKNGHTCAAGAGSIQAGEYHGFLHNGRLTSC